VGCAVPRELPAARAAVAGGPGEACCASQTCEGRPYSNRQRSNTKRPGGGTSPGVGHESQAEAVQQPKLYGTCRATTSSGRR
jgi:hypothetical protein